MKLIQYEKFAEKLQSSELGKPRKERFLRSEESALPNGIERSRKKKTNKSLFYLKALWSL